jgi:predicted nucleic acid-binding protein
MRIKVVDASAVAAILFNEPEGAVIADRLHDAALVAPSLLEFEMTSICCKKLRRHPENRDALLGAFGMQARLAIETVDIDHRSILDLAEVSDLTTYDASYLWLAIKLNAELVTLDKQLAAAAVAHR